MSDLEDIQRLIRLKQYEKPTDDFVADFVSQFRERQRGELLRQSARGLLWERMTTYFEDLMLPRWGMATAATAAVVLTGFLMMRSGDAGGGVTLASNGGGAAPRGVASVVQERDLTPVGAAFNVESALIGAEVKEEPYYSQIFLSKHFSGGYSDEVSNQIAGTDSNVVPAAYQLRSDVNVGE